MRQMRSSVHLRPYGRTVRVAVRRRCMGCCLTVMAAAHSVQTPIGLRQQQLQPKTGCSRQQLQEESVFDPKRQGTVK